MPLAAGQRLGPYEIGAPLGAGGMGEVFKARDTRLGRSVAIKVSSERFSERFENEARAIAALNHPNICQLYDVGSDYLVMELVDGEVLAGPHKLKDAMPIIEQLIDGIEAAHEKGIIHRDLKPMNVKVTAEGRVKILDFGLAKASEPPAGASPESSPTMTLAAAHTGMIVGTAAYMSPEQARGRTADRRSDIWSFGVMTFELLTGRRLFSRTDIVDTLAAVIHEEPDLDAAPAELHQLLKACLEKDPKKRLQAIGDARLLLTDVPSGSVKETRRGAIAIPWIAAAICAGLAIWASAHGRQTGVTGSTPGLSLSIVPPAGVNWSPVGALSVDRISPDGSAVLAHTTDGNFRIRRLDSQETQVLPHLDYSGDSFWSPDSKSIAIPTVNGMTKIRLPNGAPQPITPQQSGGRGGTWSEKGTLLFAQLTSTGEGFQLYGVSADGGNVFPVEVPGIGPGRYYNPEFLPGGEDFLFLFVRPGAESAEIYLATLEGTRARNPSLLTTNDTAAAFTPAGGGWLLFVRNDNLYKQRFDVRARKLSGDPELVEERVVSNPAFRTPGFSVSRSGTIVWRSGTAALSHVVVFDRKGNHIGFAGGFAPINVIHLAPNENQILATGEAGAWVMDADGPSQERTGVRLGRFAVWSPDGSHVITDDGEKLIEAGLKADAERRQLGEVAIKGGFLHVMDISPNGRSILYGDFVSGLFLFSVDERKVVAQPVREHADSAALSPDGNWIAFSPYSERRVFVQPLTGPGFRKQIASAGYFPVWRGDGKEILFFQDGRVWSVGVKGSAAQPQFGTPEALFPVAQPLGLTSGGRPLAVNHDGSRIYFLQSTEEPEASVIQVRTGAVK